MGMHYNCKILVRNNRFYPMNYTNFHQCTQVGSYAPCISYPDGSKSAVVSQHHLRLYKGLIHGIYNPYIAIVKT